ncbi:MAG TPA: hypothetical protein VNV43_07465 [Candidatus Acidoferrales bacterium]|jgi:hypothetical protein|nr:hypothetical protein [Candidatus Acidoferrales bacterium]
MENRSRETSAAAKGQLPGEIPIVLTATIIPNSVTATASDPERRLQEYMAALDFYLSFAPVFFLENSAYPLERHPEFRETGRLHVRRFQPSARPERGKGYQEFELLDSWISTEPQPPSHWLKITGRYQILNISSLLAECRRNANAGLLIEQLARSGFARTYYFMARTDFYRRQVMGLYQQCDDRNGNWIERVLFRKLKGLPPAETRFFGTQPRIRAVAGTSGASFPTGRGQWMCKQVLRRLNQLIDRRYLWYSK